MSYARWSLIALCMVVATCLVGCPEETPSLALSAQTHHFGLSEESWSFTLWNAGGQKLFFEIDVDQPWLDVSPASGSSEGVTDVQTITVTLDRDAKAADTYYAATLTIESSGGNASVEVTTAPDYLTEAFDENDFDLAFTRLLFTPTDSPDFYEASRSLVDDFGTDPAGGTDLASFFQQGDPIWAAPIQGWSLPFYGHDYDSFYIGSDGYLSFAAPSQGESGFGLSDHFAVPRISGLFRNLAPQDGGAVSLKQEADRIAVTYEDVPEAGVTSANNFQIEMFFNGDIALTYLGIDSRNAIVGLSDGEALYYPAEFVETDFSAYNTATLKTRLAPPAP